MNSCKAKAIVLRFWNNEVLADLDGVHQTIAPRWAHRRPPPMGPIKGAIKRRDFEADDGADGTCRWA
jgi:hypothetical protein